MSYDVYLHADLGGPRSVSVGHLDDANYTYNLSGFFNWFLGKHLSDFKDADASDLADAIEQGFQKFGYNYGKEPVTLDFLKSFEPENNWGSVIGALAFLFKIYRACIYAPNAKVGVS